MRDLKLPSDAVLVLVARATETGPHVDVALSDEWWAGANKEHRKALFVGAVEALGRTGGQVIPEEFTGQKLDPPALPAEVVGGSLVYVVMAWKNIHSLGDLAVEPLCAYASQERAEQRADNERKHGPAGTVFYVETVAFSDEAALRL